MDMATSFLGNYTVTPEAILDCMEN